MYVVRTTATSLLVSASRTSITFPGVAHVSTGAKPFEDGDCLKKVTYSYSTWFLTRAVDSEHELTNYTAKKLDGLGRNIVVLREQF